MAGSDFRPRASGKLVGSFRHERDSVRIQRLVGAGEITGKKPKDLKDLDIGIIFI